MIIQTPEDLDLLLVNARVTSLSHPDVVEEKRSNGCWYVLGSDRPFEPDLPVVVSE